MIAFRPSGKIGCQYYWIQASPVPFGPYVTFVERIDYTPENKSEVMIKVNQIVIDLNNQAIFNCLFKI